MLDEYLMYIVIDDRKGFRLEPYEPMGEPRYGTPMINKDVFTLLAIKEAQSGYRWNIEHGNYKEADKFCILIKSMQQYVKNSPTFRDVVNVITGGADDEQTA